MSLLLLRDLKLSFVLLLFLFSLPCFFWLGLRYGSGSAALLRSMDAATSPTVAVVTPIAAVDAKTTDAVSTNEHRTGAANRAPAPPDATVMAAVAVTTSATAPKNKAPLNIPSPIKASSSQHSPPSSTRLTGLPSQ